MKARIFAVLSVALVVTLSIAQAEAQIRATDSYQYQAHEPIELRADLEIPAGFVVAKLDWTIDRPAAGREYEEGNVFCIWAPAGRYDCELEALLLNWETREFREIERVYTVWVQGAQPPPVKPPPVDPPPAPAKKVDRVTYIYEKEMGHVVPREIAALFAELNAAGEIVATAIDQDVRSGAGTIPEQYVVALRAAGKVGRLPLVVVEADGAVVATLNNPQTSDEIRAVLK